MPSPLKSPIATEIGPEPTGISGTAGEVNPPAPSPRRIETLFDELLATAKSCLPSLLKSPIATEKGRVPTTTAAAAVKPPAPSPRKIETLLVSRLATARSCMPSLLKSPTATEVGRVPTGISGMAGKINPVTKPHAVPFVTVSMNVVDVETPWPNALTVTV